VHVALIPDGNRRWAKEHGAPALEGHRRGAEAMHTTVEHLVAREIKYLTVWGFSTDNWRRSGSEVNNLFQLLAAWIEKDTLWVHRQGVCRNINYRRDIGEFWQTPSETLKGNGDCEDTSILLTSLIRAGGTPNCYVVLGNLEGYGHSWCQLDGQILETTYTSARPVPDPQAYCPYVCFNSQEVLELWPGALDDVFSLRRDETAKLNLIAEAVQCMSL